MTRKWVTGFYRFFMSSAENPWKIPISLEQVTSFIVKAFEFFGMMIMMGGGFSCVFGLWSVLFINYLQQVAI